MVPDVGGISSGIGFFLKRKTLAYAQPDAQTSPVFVEDIYLIRLPGRNEAAGERIKYQENSTDFPIFWPMAKNESTKHFARFEANRIYHIYNRGNNGRSIFSSDRNRDFFLQRMRKYIHPYIDLLAWVLMGNHFHLLIRVKEIDEAFFESAKQEGTIKATTFLEDLNIHDFLIDQFKRWFNSYVKAYNKEQGHTGSLFEKRFRRILVRNNFYTKTCIHYINNNPVHHGFVDHPRDWGYSSYGEVLSGNDFRVNVEAVLAFFEEDVAVFRVYHEERIGFEGYEGEVDQ